MADIASTDVVYTIQSQEVMAPAPTKRVQATLVFGNGTLTYPTGGVPVSKGSLGFPSVISTLSFIDAASGNGFVYKYDLANAKIRIYQGDNDAVADGALVELAGGSATPAAATLKVLATGY